MSKNVRCDRHNTFARFSEDDLLLSWLFARAASGGVNVEIGGTMKVSFCVPGVAFGKDLSCVECNFAWQAQYLGHFHAVIAIPAFRMGAAAPCDIACVFHAILPGRCSTW